MKKPPILAEALAQAVPQLGKRNVDVQIYTDQGKIAARGMDGAAFEFAYRLNVEIFNLPEALQAQVFAVVLAFVARYQPELVLGYATNDQVFSFETDILGDKLVDLDIKLQLSEAVVAAPRDGGGYELAYRDEPEPEWPGESPLRELYIDGELVGTWPAP